MGWNVSIDYLGIEIPRRSIKNSQGYEVGYHFDHPITDLKRDLHKLKPAVCSVDREGTYAWKQYPGGLGRRKGRKG